MRYLFLAATFLVFPLSAEAQKPPPPLSQAAPKAQANDLAKQVFGEVEKRLLREVLGASPAENDVEDSGGKGKKAKNKGNKGKGKKGMPPGLAKRDKLPPGLQKRLDRGDSLPPGLQKRALPEGLESRLPKRDNAERTIVGNDVLLIEKGTNLVLDVLLDVVK